MNDVCTYHIQLRGHVDEGDINATSPLQMMVVQVEADKEHPVDKGYPYTATLITICADQAGLIGLLRHLHGLGFVFLSVSRVDKDIPIGTDLRAGERCELAHNEPKE
jgi:hypothetical protein